MNKSKLQSINNRMAGMKSSTSRYKEELNENLKGRVVEDYSDEKDVPKEVEQPVQSAPEKQPETTQKEETSVFEKIAGVVDGATKIVEATTSFGTFLIDVINKTNQNYRKKTTDGSSYFENMWRDVVSMHLDGHANRVASDNIMLGEKIKGMENIETDLQHLDLYNQYAKDPSSLNKEQYDKLMQLELKEPIEYVRERVKNSGRVEKKYIQSSNPMDIINGIGGLVEDPNNTIDKSLQNRTDLYNEYVQKYKNDADDLINSAKKEYSQNLYDVDILRKEAKTTKRPDKYYQNKRDSIKEASITDIDTWLYKLPGTVGSSMSNPKLVAAGIGLGAASVALEAFSGGAATPAVALMWGAIGAGSIANTVESRREETGAETYDQYKTRIKDTLAASGVNIYDENFLKSAATKNGKIPSDFLNMTAEEKFNYIIEHPTSNPQFENLKSNLYKGIPELYAKNMALDGSDLIQTGLTVIPLGNVFAKIPMKVAGKVGQFTLDIAAKSPRLAKALEISSEITEEGLKRSEKFVRYMDKIADIDKGVGAKLGEATWKRAKKFSNWTGRAALSSFMERHEEGTQFILGQQYQKGEYDKTGITRDGGFFGDMFSGMNLATMAGTYGAEVQSVLTDIPYLGDPALKSNVEFNESKLLGGMLGLLQGEAMSLSTGAALSPLKKYGERKNAVIRDIVMKANAEQLKSIDAVEKAKMYSSKAVSKRENQLWKAFDDLENNLPEGITVEDVRAERKRAEQIVTLANNPQIANFAKIVGIDRNDDTYHHYVALVQKSVENVKELEKSRNESGLKFNSAVSAVSNAVHSELNELAQANNEEFDVDPLIINEAVRNHATSIGLFTAISQLVNEGRTSEANKLTAELKTLTDKWDEFRKENSYVADSIQSMLASYKHEDGSTLPASALNHLITSTAYNEELIHQHRLLGTKTTKEDRINYSLKHIDKYRNARLKDIEDVKAVQQEKDNTVINQGSPVIPGDNAREAVSKIEVEDSREAAAIKDYLGTEWDLMENTAKNGGPEISEDAKNYLRNPYEYKLKECRELLEKIKYFEESLENIDATNANEYENAKEELARLTKVFEDLKKDVDALAEIHENANKNKEKVVKEYDKKNNKLAELQEEKDKAEQVLTEQKEAETQSNKIAVNEIEPSVDEEPNDVEAILGTDSPAVIVSQLDFETEPEVITEMAAPIVEVDEVGFANRHSRTVDKQDEPIIAQTENIEQEPATGFDKTIDELVADIERRRQEAIEGLPLPNASINILKKLKENHYNDTKINSESFDLFLKFIETIPGFNKTYFKYLWQKVSTNDARLYIEALSESGALFIGAYQLSPFGNIRRGGRLFEGTVKDVIDYLFSLSLPSEEVNGIRQRKYDTLDKINAKYDAELAELYKSKASELQQIDTTITIDNQEQLDNKSEASSINSQEAPNDQDPISEAVAEKDEAVAELANIFQQYKDAMRGNNLGFAAPNVGLLQAQLFHAAQNLLAKYVKLGIISLREYVKNAFKETKIDPKDDFAGEFFIQLKNAYAAYAAQNYEMDELDDRVTIGKYSFEEFLESNRGKSLSELEAEAIAAADLQTRDISPEVEFDQNGQDAYSHTFFYAFNTNFANTGMNLPGVGQTRGAAELAIVASKPDFFETHNIKYHVSEYNGVKAIYMIINNKKDSSKVYAAALKDAKGVKALLDKKTIDQEIVSEVISRLETFRSQIFSKFIEKRKDVNGRIYYTTADGNNIVPVGLKRTNGKFKVNFAKDGKTIEFRPINEIKGLQLGTEFKGMMKKLFAIGYGKGLVGEYNIVDFEGSILNFGSGLAGQIYIYPNKNLIPGENKKIPIMINHRKMSHKDKVANEKQNRILANFVTELISQLNGTSENARITDKDGKIYTKKAGISYDIKLHDFINFIINFGEQTKTKTSQEIFKTKQFYVDSTSQTLYFGNDVVRLSDVTPGSAAFDRVVKYVYENGTWAFDSNVHSQKISDIFPGIKDLMQDNSLEKLSIVEGLLEFDKEDLELDGVEWGTKYSKYLSDLHDDIFEGSFIYSNGIAEQSPEQQIEGPTAQQLADQAKPSEIKEEVRPKKKRPNLLDGTGAFAEMRVDGKEEFVQANIEKELKWLSHTLGNVESDVVDAVLMAVGNGVQIYGMMRADAIVLSSQAIQGTTYHEAFHRVSLLLRNPAQRKALYEGFRKANKLDSSISDKQIEELLAEEFRAYMLTSKPDTMFYPIIKFFRSIASHISTLLNINSKSRNRLFRDIRYGVFKNKSINKESLASFEASYNGLANFRRRGVTLKTIQNGADFKEICGSLTFVALQLNKINSADVESRLDLQLVKDYLMDNIEDPENEIMEKNKEVLQEIYDNFDNIFKDEIISKLRSIKMNVQEIEEDDMEIAESGGERLGEKASYEVDPVHNVMAQIKIMLATMPDTELSEKDKRPIAKVSELTGMYNSIDFQKAWDNVAYTLGSSTNAKSMMDKIAMLGVNNSFFKALHNRLLEASMKDENIITQFYVTLKKHRHDFGIVEVFIKRLTDGITYAYNVIRPNSRTELNKIIGGWSSNVFAEGKMVSELINEKTGTKMIVANPINIDRIINFFSQNVQEPLMKIYSEKKEVSLEEFVNIKTNFIKALQAIGISDVTPEVLDALINKDATETSDQFRFAKYILEDTEFNGGKVGSIKSFFNGERFGLNSLKIKAVLKSTSELDLLYTKTPALRKIADAVLHVNPANTSKVLGPDGKTFFTIATNNTITDTINELNENYNNVVDKLKRVPFAAGSMVIKALEKGRKMSVVTHMSMQQKGIRAKGKDFFDVSTAEDYMLKMAYTMNHYMTSPTLADKKSYYVIAGVELFKSVFNTLNDGKLSLNENVYEQFFEYFLAEFETIKRSAEELKKIEEAGRYDLLVDNYYKGKKNGLKFRNFNFSIERSNGSTTTLNEILDKLGTEKGLDYIRQLMIDNQDHATIKSIFEKNIEKAINKEIELCVELGVLSFKNNRLISNTLDTSWIDSNINSKDNKSYSDRVYNVIATHTINTLVSNIEFQKIISKDPAFYKSKDDEIKRLGGFNSTGENGREDFPTGHYLANHDGKYNVVELADVSVGTRWYDSLYSNFLDNYKRDYTNILNRNNFKSDEAYNKEVTRLAEIAAKAQLETYKEINITDASVMISPEMYKNILMRWGDWTPEVAKAFELLESDNKWLTSGIKYNEALSVILKPLKYVYMGNEFRKDGLDIPIYNKMAMFPVFKAMASTGDMRNIYDRMTSKVNSIDMFKFESATKIGGKFKVNVYNEDADGLSDLSSMRDLNEIPAEVIYKENYRQLRKQLVTDPHEIDRTLTGTQVIKAALANINEESVYDNIIINGQPATGADIVREMFACINELSEKGVSGTHDSIYEKLGVEVRDGKIELDPKKLGEIMSEEAIKSNMSEEIVKSFDVVNGKFVIPLQTLSNSKWIEQKFISFINKRAIEIRMPGNSFIQMSSFGFQTLDTERRIKGISGEGYTLNNGEQLKFGDGTTPTEAIITINMFHPIMPSSIKEKSFAEQRQWLIDNNLVGENADTMGMGYRIPTQGQSSIDAIVIRDVLPSTVGDVIVLPHEFTKKNGSDFDVDKLFLARYNYKIDSEKNAKRVQFNDEYDESSYSDKYEANSREALENRMLDMYLGLLTSKHHVSETKASIDTVTEKLKGEVLKFIRDARNVSKKTYAFEGISPSFHVKKKQDNVVSKNGIGPFALNGVHHVLTQISKIFIQDAKANAYGLYDIKGIYGRDNFRILDWLSAMINAHVDAAKDPYITELNVVPYTYAHTALLLRAGVGESTFYFLSQPIISDMLKLKNDNPNLSEKEVRNIIIESYGNLVPSNVSNIFDAEFLKKSLTRNTTGEDAMNWQQDQLAILEAFDNLFRAAKEISEFVSISQIDTKKQGNTLTNIRIFLDRVNNFKKNSTKTKQNIPVFTNIDKFFENTFQNTKLKNGAMLPLELFKDYLLSGHEVFVALEKGILTALNQRFTKNEDFINSVYKGVSAMIKSSHYNNIIQHNYSKIVDMTKGKNSLANRLLEIHNAIKSGAYPEFFRDGEITNEFLAAIKSEFRMSNDNENTPLLIGVNKAQTQQFNADQQIRTAWEDLLYIDIEENDKSDIAEFKRKLRSFAEDMVHYSFYANADNPGLNNLFQYVPTIKKVELGYTEFLPTDVNSLNTTMDDVFKNMSYDRTLVPEIQSRNIDGNSVIERNLRIAGGSVGETYTDENGNRVEEFQSVPIIFSVTKDTAAKLEVGSNKNGRKVFKPFIVMTVPVGVSKQTILYKFVGIKKVGNNPYVPIYAISQKKGYSAKGFSLTEYTGGFGSKLGINNIETSDGKSIFFADKPGLTTFLNKNIKFFGDVLSGDKVFIFEKEEERYALVQDLDKYNNIESDMSDETENDITFETPEVNETVKEEQKEPKDLKEGDTAIVVFTVNGETKVTEATVLQNLDLLSGRYAIDLRNEKNGKMYHFDMLANGEVDVMTTEDGKFINKPDITVRFKSKKDELKPQSTSVVPSYYVGNITPDVNTVFVFGSNPVGINGNPAKRTGGAALVASEQFGVKQGEKMDNRLSDSGNAYGLTTVTYPGKKSSMTPDQITDGIKKLYEVAKQNPTKQFKVAYRNTTDRSLNGYTGLEMIEMFNKAGERPSNIIFSKEWVDTGKLNSQSTSIDKSNETKTKNVETKVLTSDQLAFLEKLGITEEQYHQLDKEVQDRIFGCNK